jgi:2',3'-cyclic-nucleotide 2'-phosphodiesterase (5'-nucleotidase family)
MPFIARRTTSIRSSAENANLTVLHTADAHGWPLVEYEAFLQCLAVPKEGELLLRLLV